MEKVACFEKVSFRQFYGDLPEKYREDALALYDVIVKPKRATAGSAGYDFSLPYDLELKPGETARIPTGIRCEILNGWVLQIFPRSSLGFRYRLQLDNTVGIIDADYYHAANEGHIQIQVTNNSDRQLSLKQGNRFAQGIFVPFGICVDDDASAVRTGGFGSTDQK
ncbi:MAG: dUTP diphosphatase [Erysipelotrichaceae bacterium]|nr:dUTP diphosphatase [Erysipelotrichaceae bacterium]